MKRDTCFKLKKIKDKGKVGEKKKYISLKATWDDTSMSED